ncbi:MAG: ATP-binding protein, partial [Candidatus Marinimicrobia bacterium]|nr:ATP-binding protein [Candidatus Neomarinimicrobiota bacterium]
MKNPFVYGEAVMGENFTDRTKELAEITRDLSSGERLFLISPRRYGKTSLILKALEELKKNDFYIVYMDLYKATSLQAFLEIYTRSIATAVETKTDKILNFFKNTLPGLRPTISLQPDGSASVGIELVPKVSDVLNFLDQIYDLPQKLAKKKGRNFIIVFDEFQEILNLDGESMEKTMRACFQHHDRVGYLFAGSKRHILYDMVSNPERAFYKMGRIINLEKLPRLEFIDFLLNAFKTTGYKIESETLDTLLDLVEDYPYNAQYFCHKLWDEYADTKVIRSEYLEPTLIRILNENAPVYISIWDSLTLHQRRVLQAIARNGGQNILSQEFILENNLGNSSSVQTSIRLLMKRQILDRESGIYFLTDVFFREWIRHLI